METIANTSSSKPTEREMEEIVKSFRTIAGDSNSRIEFIQRAKRMLSDKRKEDKYS